MAANPGGRGSAPDRRPLSRNRIVDRALQVARVDGLAAVSMRRLGRELGVQPMSLYYHIPGRAVLMMLMASRSVSGLPGPDLATPWDERLVTLLVDTYRAGVDYPALFPVLASEILGRRALPPMEQDTVAASTALVERLGVLLAEGGIAPEFRMQPCRTLIGLVVGFLVGQVDGIAATMDEPSDANPRAGVGRQQQVGLPATLHAMPVDEPLQDLIYALRLVVRGLRAEVPRVTPEADPGTVMGRGPASPVITVVQGGHPVDPHSPAATQRGAAAIG